MPFNKEELEEIMNTAADMIAMQECIDYLVTYKTMLNCQLPMSIHHTIEKIIKIDKIAKERKKE